MKRQSDGKRVYTRREFFGATPLAMAGSLIVGVLSGRSLLTRLGRRREPPAFPEGSIFTPAKRSHDEG